MAKEYVLCNKSDLVSVADSIRTKSGTSGAMRFPQDFVDGVSGIEAGGGGTNIDTCTVSINNKSTTNLTLWFVVLGTNGLEIQQVMSRSITTVDNVACNTFASISAAFRELDNLLIDVDGTSIFADGFEYPIQIDGVSGGTVTITIQ